MWLALFVSLFRKVKPTEALNINQDCRPPVNIKLTSESRLWHTKYVVTKHFFLEAHV